MSLLRSLGEVVRGVSDELQADLQDVAWMILDILGLRNLFESLLHELNAADSSSGEVQTHRRKRRGLIRIIGSALPLKPTSRPYLRYVALRSLSTSYDSLFSSVTQKVNDADWKNNRYEKQKHNSRHTSLNTPFTSLVNGCCESDALSDDASMKIAALEEELANLRSQVASIICRTPERPLTPPTTPVPFAAPPPPPPPPPPLPPPPPPLPPSSCPVASHLLPRKSFSEMIAENKDTINTHTEALEVTSTPKSSEGVSMVDVLKGLNKVKLKRVDRSPGGTPVRERPRSPPPFDAASIIAAALKKRFQNFSVNSPEKDYDSPSGFSSPEGTPKATRKSRWDDFSPAKKAAQTASPPPFVLRKVTNTPKSNAQNEGSSLPPFGQHLLKHRVRPPGERESSSPSSEHSDLSR